MRGKLSYLADFTVGATCGNFFGFCERESIAWLAGNLASGFALFGDIRDGIASLFRGDVVGVGIAVGGLLPVLGDGAMGADTIFNLLRQALVQLARRTDIRGLEAAVKGARGSDAGNGAFRNGKAAEDELRRRTGSQAKEQPFPADPAKPTDMKNGRKIDAWDPASRVGRESKSGYIIPARLKETLEQIARTNACSTSVVSTRSSGTSSPAPRLAP